MNQVNLPILPIPNIVFFPNTTIPILVVEPTYIRMIHDCISSNINLGIALAEPLQSFSGNVKYKPRQIGTLGKPIIIDEYEDGSLKVMVKGVSRIGLESVQQNLPHLIYKVSLLPDLKNSYIYQNDHRVIERLKLILENWIEETVDNSIEREHFYSEIGSLSQIVDYLSMFLIKDCKMRQILLENRFLNERIQIINSLLQGKFPQKEDQYVLEAIKNFESLEKVYSVTH